MYLNKYILVLLIYEVSGIENDDIEEIKYFVYLFYVVVCF